MCHDVNGAVQVSHYFDSDPTKLVAGLREDGRAPAAFIADTTTANAQVRTYTLVMAASPDLDLDEVPGLGTGSRTT